VLHRIRPLGVRVAVVAFASPAALAAYQRRSGLSDVLLLSDERRAAYSAFGFGRGSLARVWLHPGVWWRYARLIAGGRRLERPHGDLLQLGGDVLLDAEGRVRWVHRSRGPEDQPRIAEVEAAVRDARRWPTW
jgi:hypothetical protein